MRCHFFKRLCHKKLWKFDRKSVLFRSFAAFLLISIPVYVVSITATIIGSNIVAAQAENASKDKLYFFTSAIEDEISNTKQMLVALNLDNDFSNFYKDDSASFSYDDFESFLKITSKMREIYLSSNYLSDVFIIYPQTGREISVSYGFRNIDEFMKAQISGGKLNEDELNEWVDGDKFIFSILNENGNVVGFEVSQDQILQKIRQYQFKYKINVFLLDKETGAQLDGSTLTQLDKKIYENLNCTHAGEVLLDGTRYIVEQVPSGNKLFNIVFYIPKKQLMGSLSVLNGLLWLLLLSSVMICASLAAVIDRQIQKPLKKLVQSMKEVETGNYEIQIAGAKDDEFGYVYRQFNRMNEKTHNLIREVLEKKIQVEQSKLKQLQSQINPHFLFNCLYMGYRMAKSEDTENVARLCEYLGDYFKFITYSAGGKVNLKDEIHYTYVYLQIQKMRFSEKLDFSVQTSGNLDCVMVPSMIIQPIVENSIRHGIEKSQDAGFIRLSVTVNEKIDIQIEDNGAGMTSEKIEDMEKLMKLPFDGQQKHCGLRNVNMRLKYTYGPGYMLSFSRGKAGGLSVRLEFPASDCDFQDGNRAASTGPNNVSKRGTEC